MSTDTIQDSRKLKKTKILSFKLVVEILILLVSSWFIVHIFAGVGIFLVIAYPIWWLLFPKHTICLSCRHKKVNKKCSFCDSVVKEGKYYPKNFRSVLINTFIFFIITVLSVLFVFLEREVLRMLNIPATQKTVSLEIPSKGQYKLNEIFYIDVIITGIGVPINAVQADLLFDSDYLEVIDVSIKDSFATIFMQKEIDNDLGFVRLLGGIPNPGYYGESAKFMRVIFKGKKPGLSEVEFIGSSKVLANDGKGTNVLKDTIKSSYLILAEEISEYEIKLQEELLEQEILGISDDKTQLTFFEEELVSDFLDNYEDYKDEEEKDIFEKLVDIQIFFTDISLKIWDNLF